MRAAALAVLLASATGAAAQTAAEFRRFLCEGGVEMEVAAIPVPEGRLLVMMPEGRLVVLLPAAADPGWTGLHVEQPPPVGPPGRYLWRERDRTPGEAAEPDRLAWTAELLWRDDAGDRPVYRCRPLPA
jgi:hypothetical protein